jgi:S-adenosylmethionine synthetase
MKMEVRIEVQAGLWAGARPVEIVERKGLGHPDTICDMLSEQLSVALSREYLDQFGLVLHHNVDKALLAAGRSEPVFGGGRLIEPIDIYLSGRVTMEVRGKSVPVRALAEETGAGAVFWNRRYEPAVIARDAQVKKALGADGLEKRTCLL